MAGSRSSLFEYNYQLSFDDYLNFNLYHSLDRKESRQAFLAFRFMLPVLSVIAIAVFFIAGAEKDFIVIEAFFLAIVSAIWVAFSKKVMAFSIKRNLKRMMKSGKLPYTTENHLIFDGEQIIEISERGTSAVKYSSIENADDTGTAVYVYISAAQAFIIPQSAFAGDEDKRELLKYLYSVIETENKEK